LIDCEICLLSNYREKIFEMFPTLEILDNKDKEGIEVKYDGDEDEDDYGDSDPEDEDD